MPSKVELASSGMPSTTENVSPNDEDRDFEEITETRIIGITETGVIRKRSFKRKVRKEEKSKRLSYGNQKEEYDKIRERVFNSKMVSESVANLKERFRMIQFMHEDCMDLYNKWQETRNKRIRKEKSVDKETLLLVAGAVCIFVLWFLARILL